MVGIYQKFKQIQYIYIYIYNDGLLTLNIYIYIYRTLRYSGENIIINNYNKIIIKEQYIYAITFSDKNRYKYVVLIIR